MTIVRYENLIVNTLVLSTNTVGEQETNWTYWFSTRGLVHSVANSLRITDALRIYSDLVQITLNYTPNVKTIVDDQDHYSINWRGFDWRITQVKETDDRQKTILICYRNDPETRP
jgi:hypothetical protein